jgi:hypothetical protein
MFFWSKVVVSMVTTLYLFLFGYKIIIECIVANHHPVTRNTCGTCSLPFNYQNYFNHLPEILTFPLIRFYVQLTQSLITNQFHVQYHIFFDVSESKYIAKPSTYMARTSLRDNHDSSWIHVSKTTAHGNRQWHSRACEWAYVEWDEIVFAVEWNNDTYNSNDDITSNEVSMAVKLNTCDMTCSTNAVTWIWNLRLTFANHPHCTTHVGTFCCVRVLLWPAVRRD